MSDQEQKFADWLDGKSSRANSGSTQADKCWQDREAMAQQLFHQASLEGEKAVPAWDRGSTFGGSEEKSWWQWSGLPVLSMACSLFAVALVLLKVELVVQDEGILLSFAGNSQAQQQAQQTLVNTLVEQKLKEFASEQQVVLANYAADIVTRQQDNNLQLASYILDASRQERQEDIGDFISYINDQRKDEQLAQKIKFQQLEHKIKLQTISNTSSAKTAKPANWRLEE
ncbi:hypothetical protein [Thalassomonas sp. RHCl1]|uniref:hypothetical protein n=1 Tax=Thalassomonas sp. RHCl1 TaxID=2995320 RepID=UPI00248CAF75|nr:hypothetical protein [Thalassomonas sp. RHCl1]